MRGALAIAMWFIAACADEHLLGRDDLATPCGAVSCVDGMTTLDGPGAPIDGPMSSVMACFGTPGTPCSGGTFCYDDPRDLCVASTGTIPCPGVCLSPSQQTCGGLAGLLCPGGTPCFDDPRDACEDVDCPGICL